MQQASLDDEAAFARSGFAMQYLSKTADYKEGIFDLGLIFDSMFRGRLCICDVTILKKTIIYSLA